MRTLIGYPIWCKPDHAEWIASGVHLYTDWKTTDVALFFDACDCYTMSRFKEAFEQIAVNHNVVYVGQSDKQIYEGGGHDVLLRYFANNPQYTELVIPQDDQRIIERSFVDSIRATFQNLGDNAGVIGCRDGFDFGYANFLRSSWSESKMGVVAPAGSFSQRVLHNRGPVCYPRGITDKIGFLDVENFPTWYTETDYAIRSHLKGLTNGLVSSNIEHAKFGRVKASEVYDDRQAHDAETLKLKYPMMKGIL